MGKKDKIDFTMLKREFSEYDGFYRRDGDYLKNKLIYQFLYQYIQGFENKKLQAYFSIAHLCKLTKECDRTIRTKLNQMKYFGLISWKEREGDTKIYNTLPITESMLSGNFDDEQEPSSKSKQAVMNAPVSEPVEVAPEPAQHSVTRNIPSYDNLFDDDEPDFDVHQPKQTISHATPQEILAYHFVQWYKEGNFNQCKTFEEAVICCKNLMLSEKGRSINVPTGFKNHIMTNHSDVYEHWGIAF